MYLSLCNPFDSLQVGIIANDRDTITQYNLILSVLIVSILNAR